MQSEASSFLSHEAKSYPIAESIDFEGGSIRYLRWGEEGSLIVFFLHGAPGRGAEWAGVVDALMDNASEPKSVALDRPGYGENSQTRSAFSVGRQLEAFQRILDEEGQCSFLRVLLVGHSYGAALALPFAALLQDRGILMGLVLVSGVLDPNQSHDRWYHKVLRLPLVKNLAPARYVQASLEMGQVKRVLEQANRFWENTVCKTLLLHGTTDKLIRLSNSEYVQTKVPQNCIFVPVENAGHDLPHSQERLVAENIRKFIEEISSEGDWK